MVTPNRFSIRVDDMLRIQPTGGLEKDLVMHFVMVLILYWTPAHMIFGGRFLDQK